MNKWFIVGVCIVHALAAAAWFGAMFYSLTTLQPRARTFFDSDEAFEEFTAFVASGARWKVLAALAVMLASGATLMMLEYASHPSAGWRGLMIVKSIGFVVALAVFINASWRLWPKRIFARGAEVAAIQKSFKRVGYSLIAIAAIEIASGIAARWI